MRFTGCRALQCSPGLYGMTPEMTSWGAQAPDLWLLCASDHLTIRCALKLSLGLLMTRMLVKLVNYLRAVRYLLVCSLLYWYLLYWYHNNGFCPIKSQA